jgi:hypothetical protein
MVHISATRLARLRIPLRWYRGGVGDPLDSPAVWRYIAKDCLRAPTVSAVEEFRKAIAEAEKPQPPKKP